MRPIYALLTFCWLASTTFAQLNPVEVKGLENAMFLANLERKELSFERRFSIEPFRMTWADENASDPIAMIDRLMGIHESARPEISRSLRAALAIAYPGTPSARSLPPAPANVFPDGVPVQYHEAIQTLANSLADCTARIRTALDKLSADERRDVIETLPRLICPDDSTKFDFVRRPKLSHRQTFELLAKVDLLALAAAGFELVDTVQNTVPRLVRIARDTPFAGLVKFELGRTICVLAGTENNEHVDRDAALTIDLGGNDRYSGRHGAGVGYASVLIDLSGDDQYLGPDLNVGAGVLGVGIGVDLGGNDTIRSGSIAFGSGLGGIGVFFDGDGHDVARCGSMAMGFGAFGIGLYLDAKGSDIYDLRSHGFGAGWSGGMGWFIDSDGDDQYRSLGIGNRLESNSMGWGAGASGLASGGIGLLTDLNGQDSYAAATRALAYGTESGIGSLYDANGRDDYFADSESMGFGSNGGSAYLFDLAGNDAYTLRGYGSQATAINFGLTVFLDRDGDDLYASRSSRPSAASHSSLAIFMDSNGQDRYGPAPLILGGRVGNSLALFADLNGNDVYADPFDNGRSIANGNGAAIDVETHGTIASPLSQPRPKPGSKPNRPKIELEALFQRAIRFESDSESAIDELVGIGQPAWDWMLAEKLMGLTDRDAEVVAELARAVGANAKDQIGFKIGDANDSIAMGALRVCLVGQFDQGGPMIVQALRRPALERLAARGAGVFKTRAAVPDLMALCARNDRNLVLTALESIAQIGDAAAVGTGQALLESSDLLIRRAALRVVLASPSSAISSARLFLRDANERKARIGCEILAALGTFDALKELGSALDDPRSGVRLQAALGLAGRCPPEKRASFMAVKLDPNPLVRTATADLDPGR